MGKFLVSALATGLFAAFAFETTADARRGGGNRGGSVRQSGGRTRGASLLNRGGGRRTGLRQGVRARGQRFNPSRFRSRGRQGLARRLARPGGTRNMLQRFRGRAGGRQRTGGFATLGRMTRGSGRFRGMLNRMGQRRTRGAGLTNRFRGVMTYLGRRTRQGSGVFSRITATAGRFASRNRGNFQRFGGKLRSVFGKLRDKIKDPAAKKALEEAQGEVQKEAEVTEEASNVSAGESAATTELEKVDPAAAKQADEEPNVPAAVDDKGEPTPDKADPDPGVDAAPVQGPPADVPGADAPGADAPGGDAAPAPDPGR